MILWAEENLNLIDHKVFLVVNLEANLDLVQNFISFWLTDNMTMSVGIYNLRAQIISGLVKYDQHVLSG